MGQTVISYNKMGLSHGVCASRLKSSEGIEKCVPTKVLKKFPHHRSASPGELIAEIKALPKKCCKLLSYLKSPSNDS